MKVPLPLHCFLYSTLIFGMLRNISIVIIVGVVGVVVFTAYVRETNPLSGYEIKIIRIGDAEVEALIADTQEKRTQGLMGISELVVDTGMIFLFSDVSPRTFWNKNTLIALDLIWITGGRVAGVSVLPSITESGGQIISVTSPEAINQVVEVVAGWAEAHGIKVGDRVE